MINIIGHKRIFLSISGFFVLASIITISVFGFKPGIDFVGGTLWQIKFTEKTVSRDELKAFFYDELALSNVIVTEENSGSSLLVRLQEISEPDHQAYFQKISAKFGKADELRFEAIGAAVGTELRSKAITAFILVLVGISLYIAFAFRKV